MGNRLGLFVVSVVLAASASRAVAAPTVIKMTPNPVDVGDVVLGTSVTATGSLSDNNKDHVDLTLTTTCTGTGTGTFSLSPSSNVNLSNPVNIDVTYMATTAGQRACRVNVFKTGTTTLFGQFNVRGNGVTPPTIVVTGTPTFGTIRFNDAAPVHTSTQSFSATNSGDQVLSITNVTITGTNATDFALTSGGTTATIPKGNTKTWVVTFDPSAAGSRTATLTFTSNDPATPNKTVALSGTGSTAVIQVNDRSFGIVDTGSSSSLDITVENIGAAPTGSLGVTTATITGGAGWFTFSACGGGASCTFMPALSVTSPAPIPVVVGVKCSPPDSAAVAETQTAMVTFTSDTDDAAATPDQVALLSCTAGKSLMSTDTSTVAFTGQLVGTVSTTQSVTITNTGNSTATFYFVLTGTHANQFVTSTTPSCGTGSADLCSIPALGTLAFTVAFQPGLEGDVSAGLDLKSAALPYPQLTIAGRGIDRHIRVETSVMFPDTFRNPGDSATVMPVAVDNIGEYPLHVSMLEMVGEPNWSLADPAMPFDVPPGGSQPVMVRFAPELAGKVPTGMLAVTSDDRTNGLVSINLLGNGKDRRVQMGPSSIDLGDTGAGVPTRLSDLRPDDLLTIANLDDATAFHIREIVIEGDQVFDVQGLGANAAIEPGATKHLDIVFTPPAIGDFEATAVLYLDQDPIPQVSIALHGRALFVDAHGGGGCSTGRGTGGGAAIGLLGALLLGRRRRRAAVIAAVLAVPAAAGADPTRNIDLTVFDPTPTTTGSSFHVQTADVGARGEYVASALASYASNPLVLGTIQYDDPVVRRQTMVALGAAFAFLDRFEAGARIPLYSQQGDTVPIGNFGVPPASGTAWGELTLHVKARLLRTRLLRAGAGLAMTLPTATEGQFAGADKPAARALALISFAPASQVTVHLNAGAVIRARAEFANIEQRSGFVGGAGVAFRMFAPLTLSLEVFGDVIPSGHHAEPLDGQTMGTTSTLATIEGLAGARFQVARQVSVSLGVGRGLTSGIGAPQLRGVFMLAVTPRAPRPIVKPRPVLDAPPPVDPTKADTDFDRIPDAVDKCPDQPEDKDGFEDKDGCPDPDNDKDGVLDAADKCPETLEDKDGFEDGDGCPDPDNDKDGILDAADKCPLEPEKINGNNDNDGCPDAGEPLIISTPDRLEFVESLAFKGTQLAEASSNGLGQLAATLRARTDIAKIRITVHVQPTKAADKDLALSKDRAEAIRLWLVNWGVDGKRLEVRGVGGTKPLVPATQKLAAQINNRVEMIIIDRN